MQVARYRLGLFLMYRVELKAEWGFKALSEFIEEVPNVPCGVESCVGYANILTLPSGS